MCLFVRAALAVAVPAMLVAAPVGAKAQDYPTKDLNFVVGFAAGSGADILVRYFAEKMKPFIAPRTVIVHNKPGAAGSIARKYAMEQPADGHTILLDAGSSIASTPWMFKSPALDVSTSVQMVGTMNRQAFMVVVPASSPYKTIADLIADMKKKGNAATYGTVSPSGIVLGELLKFRAGLETEQVRYRSSADLLNDLTSGRLQFATLDPIFSLAQAREGRLRPLAVSSAERLASVPDLPTMKESGVDMDLMTWWSLSVPKGTPASSIAKLNGWLNQILATDETKAFLNANGSDPLISTPETTQRMFLEAIPIWKEFLEIAKIEPAG